MSLVNLFQRSFHRSLANIGKLFRARKFQPRHMAYFPNGLWGHEERCNVQARTERSQDDLQQRQGEVQFGRRSH